MKCRMIMSAIFLTMTVAVLFFFWSLIFRNQKDISDVEMRRLAKIPEFSIASFADGSFQSQIEEASADQMLFSAEIKFFVKQFYNYLTASIIEKNTIIADTNTLNIENSLPLNVNVSIDTSKINPEPKKYIYQEVLTDKLYKLDNSGYLVQKVHQPEEFNFDMYDPAMLARVTFPKYLYYILTSDAVDFNDISSCHSFEYIKMQFPMTDYSALLFNSFEEYKHYFYQTDHHWNYRGSYKGYCDILRMMEGNSCKLQIPQSTHTYDAVYNGSFSRDNLLRYASEKFTVYTFNLPPYKTFVDDVETKYGFRDLYVSDSDFPHSLYSNHYGMYYGDDHAKVVYVFDNPSAESILILATSYSNAINELIASHYRETHILDFRYYRKKYGTRIDAQSYMQDHGLSKLLLLGDMASLGYQRKK